MPPPFRPIKIGERVYPRYDPQKEKRQDPTKILLNLKPTALMILRSLDKRRALSGEPMRMDGYTCRHLVEKGLVRKVSEGKKPRYSITFLGEAVVELSYQEEISTQGKTKL